MRARPSQSSEFLPIAEGAATSRGRDGSAVCDSADCLGTSAPLRIPTDLCGVAEAGNASEPQEGSADDEEDNLLALRRRRFVVTTDANHKFEVYLNLARRMKLTGIDQLWIADITYIRLKAEFVYLAVILDAFSRKVVGWALDRTLASRLAIAALEHAIAQRQPRPGLVHHSDRGLQYARGDYVAVLEKYGIVPSMSRPANPYDNASCESFIKTLKREEIYANKYDNVEHLRANIEEFIEEYYNRQRLHSALGYRPPEEFEQQSERGNLPAPLGATVEFVVNDGNGENQKRASKELFGEEDSNAVLFPGPLLLLGDTRKA